LPVYFFIFDPMKRISIKQPEKLLRQIEDYFDSTDELKFAAKLQGVLLLLRDENNNCSQVARQLGKTPQTIAGWARKLNQGKGGNIEVLRDKIKPGRSTRLSKSHMKIIKDVLRQRPTHFGMTSTKWDGSTLSEYLHQSLGITLQIRQCQRILQRLGYANKRGRPDGQD
jgi:transposase